MTTSPQTSSSGQVAVADRLPQRVRHPLRFRQLKVLNTERVTPQTIRITLQGEDLADFVSAGFDDHIKLCLPDPETGQLLVPTLTEDGVAWPGGVRPEMRDYTPRSFDNAARTLEIDFALHDSGGIGPATAWALQAKVGDAIGVAGPRGSFVVPTNFDAYLLMGDATALPAIARRLRELPAGAPALVIVEVDDAAEEFDLPGKAKLRTIWVHRHGADTDVAEFPLLAALRQAKLPAGDCHAWIACETATAKALRAHLLTHTAIPAAWIRASGYWRQGAVATHDAVEG